jgi:phosphoglucomutase
MTSRLGRDPGEAYRELTRDLGDPTYGRIDFAATPAQRAAVHSLSPTALGLTRLADEPVRAIVTTASGNGQPIGGIKVVADNAWFAVRPSGTEPICKLYVESFRGPDHARRVRDEAVGALGTLLGTSGTAGG